MRCERILSNREVCLITAYLSELFFCLTILLNRKLRIKKLLLYPEIAVLCASVTDVCWPQGHVVWSGDGVSAALCFGIWLIATRCQGSKERCGDETSIDSLMSHLSLGHPAASLSFITWGTVGLGPVMNWPIQTYPTYLIMICSLTAVWLHFKMLRWMMYMYLYCYQPSYCSVWMSNMDE